MDRQVADFAAARMLMVESQVRPNKVTDPRVIAAMRQLPRERFVPADRVALAYADEDVPLPGGRALLEPMVIARLVQMLAARPDDRALVVGCGTGYGAAILAACGARITALEEDTTLAAQARVLLAELAPGVTVVTGPLVEGWKASAPYDVILIEGGVASVPAAIAAQLRRPDGRLTTVRVTPGTQGPGTSGPGTPGPGTRGQGVLGEAVSLGSDGAELALHPVFDCATPMIPQFRREVGFVF